MATAPKKTNTPATPTPAAGAPAMTMVHGYAIQIIGFIPIPKDNLRKQAEIPQLILAVQEGEKPLTELVTHLKGIEYRMAHTGRRVTVAEVAEWNKDPKQIELEAEIARKKAEEEAKAAAEKGGDGEGKAGDNGD